MPGQLIQQCFKQLLKYHESNQIQQGTPRKRQECYYIFAATYPNEIIQYKARYMVLHVDSDAEYLTIPEERSYYAGHFHLSDWTSPIPIKPNPERNRRIHIECKKILNVVSSTAKTETCGTFNNGKTTISMRTDLISLEHKQPSTHLKNDNYTTEGFVKSGI